jgi:CheY-like chemotaxis protein
VRVSETGDGFIAIAVQDTGIGIAPENQVLIFEEFRQVQGDLTRAYQGTGLGLPISKRLIEMHGGRMWLESTPGAGSTFSFTIPIAQQLPADSTDSIDSRKAPSNGGTPVITVVDDDLDAQRILHHILDRAGYRVHGVRDSRVALDEIRRVQPSLVILDIQMPHRDGWEVLRQIQQDPALAPLPVIVCSVMDVEREQVGIFTNVRSYLHKPLRREDVLAIVRQFALPATVLVVDDDPHARRMLRNIIERVGYTVLEAPNGEEALGLLDQERPDLIMLDLIMPGMDGFEVLDRLQTMPEVATVPVVVVTAKDLDAQEYAWVLERTPHCFQKPVSSPTFLTVVENLLKGEGYATRYS